MQSPVWQSTWIWFVVDPQVIGPKPNSVRQSSLTVKSFVSLISEIDGKSFTRAFLFQQSEGLEEVHDTV